MLAQALELLRLRGVTLEALAADARLPVAVVAEIVGGEVHRACGSPRRDEAAAL